MSDSTPMAETTSSPSLRELSEAATRDKSARPFHMDRRAQAAVLADLPISVAREAGNFYENAGGGRAIPKCDAMAEAWAGVLRPYLIGLRDHSDQQARPASPTTLAEAVAAARAEGVREGLERAAAKAEEQFAYWRKRMAAEKCLEDGVSDDGETYTPIGDNAAWAGGYCNGRLSEADWWRKTFKYTLVPGGKSNV